MGLTPETIVSPRDLFKRNPLVINVLRVERRAGIRHVTAVREERKSRKD